MVCVYNALYKNIILIVPSSINHDVYIKRLDVSKMHRQMIRYTFFNLAVTTLLLSCQRVWNELRANYTIPIVMNQCC